MLHLPYMMVWLCILTSILFLNTCILGGRDPSRLNEDQQKQQIK